jgi:hypothetical protein
MAAKCGQHSGNQHTSLSEYRPHSQNDSNPDLETAYKADQPPSQILATRCACMMVV